MLRALINGLEQDRLHHAFLFTGTRGVGKTTLARIFAKSLNCEAGVSAEPCGTCDSCSEIDAGRFVDLIEVDAASRTKVEDTRELLDNVQYAPSRGRYKVYLIDEVHMLSTHSFNALLKTLEEPPPHVKFLFATTDPEKLPVTILSRCLQFTLRRLEPTQISDYLATILKSEKVKSEPAALAEIARAADGSMRDALSLLDQAISFGDGKVSSAHVFAMLGTLDRQQVTHIIAALAEQDGVSLLAQADELAAQGRDFVQALDALLLAFQRIASFQAVPDLQVDDADTALQPFAAQCSAEAIQLYYQIALHGKRDLAFAADPKSGFEMTLLRMLQFQPRAADVAMNTQPVPPTAQVPAAPKPAIKAQSEKTQPVGKKASLKKVAAKKPATTKPANGIKEEAPTTISAPTNNTALTLSAESWPSIVPQLKLVAMAKQLAENTVFLSEDSKGVLLEISEDNQHIASEKSQQRLATALGDLLGRTMTVQVDISAENSDPKQTLANKKQASKEQKQQQARDAIHGDPAVDALQKAFGATVIEQSIKPVE